IILAAHFTENSADENGDSPEPDTETQSSNSEYESVRDALESKSAKEEQNDDAEDEVFYIEVDYHSDENAKVSGEGYYEYGDNAVITAISPEGYEFYCWYEGDQIASFDAEYVFTVTRDRELTAWFEPEDIEEIYNINLRSNPEKGGTVIGSGVYPSDETAVVQAIPDTRYDFVNWTENGTVVSTEAEHTFGVTRDRNLTANFKLISYEGNQIDDGDNEIEYESEQVETTSMNSNDLYVPKNNTRESVETYTISLTVEHKEYGDTIGAGIYENNKLVGLDAIPAEGFEFTGWLEDGEKVSMAKAYAFLASEDRELVATFAPLVNRQNEEAETYRISLAPSPLEGGRVYGRGEYTEGKTITVSALPNIDYDFVSWTEDGKVVSTETIYTFIVDRDHQLVANFASYDSNEPDSEGSGYRYEFDTFLHSYFLDFLTPYTDTQKHREPSAGSKYGWSPAFIPPAGGQ
ncbi:MAG: InlB B-repeat-containing protein, partial [Bacillota bacterium]